MELARRMHQSNTRHAAIMRKFRTLCVPTFICQQNEPCVCLCESAKRAAGYSCCWLRVVWSIEHLCPSGSIMKCSLSSYTNLTCFSSRYPFCSKDTVPSKAVATPSSTPSKLRAAQMTMSMFVTKTHTAAVEPRNTGVLQVVYLVRFRGLTISGVGSSKASYSVRVEGTSIKGISVRIILPDLYCNGGQNEPTPSGRVVPHIIKIAVQVKTLFNSKKHSNGRRARIDDRAYSTPPQAMHKVAVKFETTPHCCCSGMTSPEYVSKTSAQHVRKVNIRCEPISKAQSKGAIELPGLLPDQSERMAEGQGSNASPKSEPHHEEMVVVVLASDHNLGVLGNALVRSTGIAQTQLFELDTTAA